MSAIRNNLHSKQLKLSPGVLYVLLVNSNIYFINQQNLGFNVNSKKLKYFKTNWNSILILGINWFY